jgi:hypothetical protein
MLISAICKARRSGYSGQNQPWGGCYVTVDIGGPCTGCVGHYRSGGPVLFQMGAGRKRSEAPSKTDGYVVGRFWGPCLLGIGLTVDSVIKVPVTSGYVVLIAVSVGTTVLQLVIVAFKRLVLGSYRETGSGLIGGYLGLTKEIVRALEIIAADSNLSDDTVHTLRHLLYGRLGSNPKSSAQET